VYSLKIFSASSLLTFKSLAIISGFIEKPNCCSSKAAFMSELVGEQKLKLSNMKVGGSPLYYIQGQEEQLQKFTEYLNHKEKEAFKLLKQSEILEDANQEPAIRVALRSIKDFAVPIKIIDQGQEKIFWKIHTLPNDKAKELIEEKIATITVAEDQLSLAIGKGGQNVRLAAKLTGWRIDIKSDEPAKEEVVEEKSPEEAVVEAAEETPKAEME
jgi:hypothetical protein